MLRFGYGDLRGCNKVHIYEDVCSFAAQNKIITWPTRFGQSRASANKSTSGWFQKHWQASLTTDTTGNSIVSFESTMQRDACRSYLASLGHDVSWLDPVTHAAAIAAADANIKI
eukprot:4624458-Heterocapsa_arctica.AAC.1